MDDDSLALPCFFVEDVLIELAALSDLDGLVMDKKQPLKRKGSRKSDNRLCFMKSPPPVLLFYPTRAYKTIFYPHI